MPRPWFRRLIPRFATPPPAITSGPPTRVVDVDRFQGQAGGMDWTAEWGLLDEQMVDEVTTDDLRALVEHVLADARARWRAHPDLTVQWSLHHEDGHTTDLTGSTLEGVVLPVTLHP